MISLKIKSIVLVRVWWENGNKIQRISDLSVSLVFLVSWFWRAWRVGNRNYAGQVLMLCSYLCQFGKGLLKFQCVVTIFWLQNDLAVFSSAIHTLSTNSLCSQMSFCIFPTERFEYNFFKEFFVYFKGSDLAVHHKDFACG